MRRGGPARPLGGGAAEIRDLAPAARESWDRINGSVIHAGPVEAATKNVCYRYLAGEIGEDAFAAFGERARLALEWARAIAYEADRADDALWTRLHAAFSEPELVDLGCAIGFELGQQHWRRTVGLPSR